MNISFILQQTTDQMAAAVQPCAICNCTNTTDPQPTTDQPLKVNGGFIAMAAGLSVIIPLICVLIIQLRRSKREERERAATAAAAAAASAAESGLEPGTDLPPSYEQLFGTSVNPVTSEPLHSRQSSLNLLIVTNETSRPDEASRTRAVSSNGNMQINAQIPNVQLGNTVDESPSSSERSSDGGYVNQGYSSTSVSTISGSEVFYYPLSTSFSQDNPESSSQLSLQLIHTRASDFVDAASESSETAAVTTSSDDGSSGSSSGMSTLSSGHSSLSSDSMPSLSSVSTSTSTEGSGDHQGSSLSQPPSSSAPPPPPYRSPAVSRHINNNNNTTASTTSGQSSIQQMLRRFPGMHISIQDILSSFRAPQQDITENEIPPPSYEEALKILECAKLSSQTILGKTD